MHSRFESGFKGIFLAVLILGLVSFVPVSADTVTMTPVANDQGGFTDADLNGNDGTLELSEQKLALQWNARSDSHYKAPQYESAMVTGLDRGAHGLVTTIAGNFDFNSGDALPLAPSLQKDMSLLESAPINGRRDYFLVLLSQDTIKDGAIQQRLGARRRRGRQGHACRFRGTGEQQDVRPGGLLPLRPEDRSDDRSPSLPQRNQGRQ